jgi:hypothetical protein
MGKFKPDDVTGIRCWSLVSEKRYLIALAIQRVQIASCVSVERP